MWCGALVSLKADSVVLAMIYLLLGYTFFLIRIISHRFVHRNDYCADGLLGRTTGHPTASGEPKTPVREGGRVLRPPDPQRVIV